MHVPASDDAAAGAVAAPPRKAHLDALAGAAAGAVARFIVGPLDVVKIRFQVQVEPVRAAAAAGARAPSHYTGFVAAFQTIVREEGIQGLWRGTVPGLLLTVPYTAVQFLALQQCREAAGRLGWDGSGHSTLMALGSGAVAGAAATVASYPFDLLRTTLAAQGEPKVYQGMWDAARSIRHAHGVAGLYRGLGVTLVEIMPYAALQFGLYDALNAAWTRAQARALEATHGKDAGGGKSSSVGRRKAADAGARVQYFACGLLAGLLAKLATHPLDVAKKRFQVAGLPRSLRYGARISEEVAHTGLLSCLGHIYRHEGVAGLWKGSLPSIFKAAPNAAITFTMYEVAVAWILAAHGESPAPSANGGSG